jgi:eukaryotic-like serine/threonine-protein kinase
MGDLYALNLRRARRLVGETLQGKWRLDELLGVGGMAAVYSATHRNASRAAVKVLHLGSEDDPNTRRRFQREGYVANKVGHPGVPKVLDDDVTDDGRAYLVMELLEGESLEYRLERHKQLPQDEVMQVAHQALDVLAAAHEKGIIHRDLKPDNLFLTKQGHVKVLDFGIAHLHEAASKGTAATQIGDLMGTLEFMSPEQASGQWDIVDARSDLWSLGATLFNMVTGHPVHQAKSINRMLAIASTEKAPRLADAFPDAHPKVCEAIDGALLFDLNNRFADARAMQAVVEEAFTAVCGRSIDDPLSLSIGQDDAETVTKLMAVSLPPPAIPPPPTAPKMPAGMPPRSAIEAATTPFRPPMASYPPIESMPPPLVSSSRPGQGQTWMKQALAEPGHARQAMWWVRIGFAAVVVMLIGAIVWVVTMPNETAPESPTPEAADSTPTAAAMAPTSEPSAQASTEPSAQASTEPSAEASAEPSAQASTEPSTQASSEASAAASAEQPPAPTASAVPIDSSWPPKSAPKGPLPTKNQFLD